MSTGSANIPRLNTGSGSSSTNQTGPTCHPYESTEAVILFTLASFGIVANVVLILLVIIKKPSKRYHQSWSQGLLCHQGVIDLFRSLLLVYLGISVVTCTKLTKCYMVDTSFLLLVSISTVNMLTMLINDAPIFPEHEQLGSISAAVAGAHRLRSGQSWLDVSTQIEMNEGATTPSAGAGDSPHCIVFAVFIIWFACLTIHLGPTFLSGGLTSSDGGHLDVCTMVYKPVRHYVLNVLWVTVNMMSVCLMAIHLKKLYRDIVKSNLEATRLASMVTTMIPLRSETDEENQSNLQGYIKKLEEEGASRVKWYIVVLAAYLVCWGPLYFVTMTKPGIRSSTTYEVTVHIAFAHAIVNPILFLFMYRNLFKNDNRSCINYLFFLCRTRGNMATSLISPNTNSNQNGRIRCLQHQSSSTSSRSGQGLFAQGAKMRSAVAPIMSSISASIDRPSPKRTVTQVASFDSVGSGRSITFLPPPPTTSLRPKTATSATRSSSREMMLCSSQEYDEDPATFPRPHSVHRCESFNDESVGDGHEMVSQTLGRLQLKRQATSSSSSTTKSQTHVQTTTLIDHHHLHGHHGHYNHHHHHQHLLPSQASVSSPDSPARHDNISPSSCLGHHHHHHHHHHNANYHQS